MKRFLKFKKQKLSKRWLLMPMLAVVVASVFLVPFTIYDKKAVKAATLEELKAQSSALQQQIDANNAQAQSLSGVAQSLQQQLNQLQFEIDQVTRQIELTNLKLQELDLQLQQAQAELDRQKNLLKASLQALYKKGGASTVELLVGSESFSQFINDQTYLERLKASIQTSTEQVIALKQQIQAQQDEQKTLLKDQELQKSALDATRSKQADLLYQTQGEQSRYEQMIAELQARQQQVDDEITALIRAGGLVSMGRVHTGEIIGYMGNTGYSFGHHLHFEVRDSGNNTVNPLPTSNYGFEFPVAFPNEGLNQEYGCVPWDAYYRKCGDGWSFHPGVDLGSPRWSSCPILAAGDGDIIMNGDYGDYGHLVVIRHDNGYYTYYGHLAW
jgi:septal ring factor EnvC (AmiA/AmiB activator)